VGRPIAAADEKQMSCLLLRLKMSFVFIFVRSFGTGQYGIIVVTSKKSVEEFTYKHDKMLE